MIEEGREQDSCIPMYFILQSPLGVTATVFMAGNWVDGGSTGVGGHRRRS
jgi:hypothetical protein